MAPVFGIWRASRRKLLRRVHDRLAATGGCQDVWYEPSRRAPQEVVAKVDPSAFLGREYTASEARLRVEFDPGGERHHYWIQWWEPVTGRGAGWHCDATEPEYGPVHRQIERPDGTTIRESAECVEDEHPYRSFERWLDQLPSTLEDLGWN
jgi:hypothetical protein